MPNRGRAPGRRALLVGAALNVITPISAPAQAPTGATSCSGCHAPATAGALAIPSLEGRTAASIVEDMQAFRSGERLATVMDRIAKGFSVDETRAIAEWLAENDHAKPKP